MLLWSESCSSTTKCCTNFVRLLLPCDAFGANCTSIVPTDWPHLPNSGPHVREPSRVVHLYSNHEKNNSKKGEMQEWQIKHVAQILICWRKRPIVILNTLPTRVNIDKSKCLTVAHVRRLSWSSSPPTNWWPANGSKIGHVWNVEKCPSVEELFPRSQTSVGLRTDSRVGWRRLDQMQKSGVPLQFNRS